MKKILKHHQLIFIIIALAAFTRLLFFFEQREIWWDAGVYIGMAKYLASAGSAGLWEHIRPVLLPAILGIFWWFKLNLVWIARIIEFLLALISTGLVYMLCRKFFSQRAAIISSTLWAFSAIVFFMSFHAYTELLAVTFVLGALVAFTDNRYFLAGLLASFAFLAKFPAGIFIVVIGIAILLQKRWKSLIPTGIGFAIPTAAYLIFNYLTQGSAITPLIDARESILSVLGCNVLRFQPWWQYFSWIFVDNWLNIAAIIGLVAVVYRWKKQYTLPVLALALPALYFMQMHCREYRYLVLFLPFVVMLTGHGISLITDWLERKKQWKKYIWPAILIAVVTISVFHAITFYHANEIVPNNNAERYFHWIEDKEITGEIWSSNPVISAYTDHPVKQIYYPLFGQALASNFNNYLEKNTDRIDAVFLDNCGGGIICASDDQGCENELERMRGILNEHFNLAFFAESGRCWYAIYSR